MLTFRISHSFEQPLQVKRPRPKGTRATSNPLKRVRQGSPAASVSRIRVRASIAAPMAPVTSKWGGTVIGFPVTASKAAMTARLLATPPWKKMRLPDASCPTTFCR